MTSNFLRVVIVLLGVIAFTSCGRTPLSPTAPTPSATPTATPVARETPALPPTASPRPTPTPEVVLPIAGYRERRTFKVYGQYVQDRFTGYHTGDDVEYADVSDEVPVYAIADGAVVQSRRADGYGGMIVIAHAINGKTISALYGHLDLKTTKPAGAKVKRGEQIAVLGDHQSKETDGERKHLHVHLWEGEGVKISGYARTETELAAYLNPTDFFLSRGLDVLPPAGTVSYGSTATAPPHPTFDGVSFQLPAGWAVEYVPQIQSLNLFSLRGQGTARERSQVFIRTFTADRFLTLSTVTIHETREEQISGYNVRVYDIEKKPGVPDFPHQPLWRNGRHTVTDFRAAPPPGRSVFYVVAQNPTLDDATYQQVLASLRLQQR